MPQGYCPVCETLQQITPTPTALEYREGQPVGSARYWLVVMHVDKSVEQDAEGRRPICDGSGKRV